MRIALAILLIIGTGYNDIDKIAKANKLKKEAKEAFQSGDFTTAITNYTYLLDSMKLDDDKIRLNLANAYYQSKDSVNAQSSYSNLTSSNNKLVQSTAHQQLGVIQNQQKKYKEALQSFKNALKSDPTNEDARYNYEMLKKLIKEQEEQQKEDQDQNKENKDEEKKEQDQENKEQEKEDQEQKDEEQQQKDQEEKEGDSDEEKENQEEKKGEEGDEKEEEPKEGEQEEDQEEKKDEQEMPEQSENMKEMKISEEKAKMILEAMKNNEIQYFQQNKRKPTKRKDSGKPDW
ncbi:MAG: tetratricopeptide repeat protein [Cyclobacteriaceae bacterium]|nr:tetratricopeptide repeat protein [Cyclobacteriaceae bacterium]